MCRIAAYCGPAIPLENILVKPRHSLLRQSQKATEAKLEVNGDGFGVAWYDDQGQSGVYRDVLPAWADDNLVTLSRMIRSPVFVGHVRASTFGETTRSNCHPFQFENWVFCHNGQIPHFPQIRRSLEASLPDVLYDARRGTTDSEMLFLLLLANGLTVDVDSAMDRTIRQLGVGEQGPNKITCTFSDGTSLYGYRHSTSGEAPTLYASKRLDNGGRAFASEPLCGVADNWTAIPENTVARLDLPRHQQAA